MNQKRALIVTTVSGFVPQFEMNNVRILQELGYEVHYASNFRNPHYGSDNSRLEGTGIICHQVDIERSPFRIGAAKKSYRQLRKLMQSTHFELIHCHTPMGGMLARLAEKFTRNSTDNQHSSTVIYTAHGFHFYKGAPLVNWLLYYPVERWLARYTDKLITINTEDYERAKKFRLRKAGQVFKVNGVGIDVEKYRNIRIDREVKRRELGVKDDEFLLVSVGELNANKNNVLIVKALAELKELRVHYVVCGSGPQYEVLKKTAKELGVENKITLLGYRSDIPEILAVADGFVFPSLREGLGLAAIEAMAAGLPIIAMDNRGTREYMEHGKNGYIFGKNATEKENVSELADYIQRLVCLSQEEYEALCDGSKRIVNAFALEKVQTEMRKIYQE